MEKRNGSKGLEAVTLDCEWFHLAVEIYRVHLFVFVGSRAEMTSSVGRMLEKKFGEGELAKEAAGYFEHLWDGDWNATGMHGESFQYKGVCFVRLSQMSSDNFDDLIVLCHESIHIANWILQSIGFKGDATNEALCYLHEYIVRKIMDQMSEKGIAYIKVGGAR